MAYGFKDLAGRIEPGIEGFSRSHGRLTALEAMEIEMNSVEAFEAEKDAIEAVEAYAQMTSVVEDAEEKALALEEFAYGRNFNSTAVQLIVASANESIELLAGREIEFSEHAMESNNGNELAVVAIETIKETAKKAWEKLKSFFISVVAKAKLFAAKILTSMVDYEKKFEKLEEELDNYSDEFRADLKGGVMPEKIGKAVVSKFIGVAPGKYGEIKMTELISKIEDGMMIYIKNDGIAVAGDIADKLAKGVDNSNSTLAGISALHDAIEAAAAKGSDKGLAFGKDDLIKKIINKYDGMMAATTVSGKDKTTKYIGFLVSRTDGALLRGIAVKSVEIKVKVGGTEWNYLKPIFTYVKGTVRKDIIKTRLNEDIKLQDKQAIRDTLKVGLKLAKEVDTVKKNLDSATKDIERVFSNFKITGNDGGTDDDMRNDSKRAAEESERVFGEITRGASSAFASYYADVFIGYVTHLRNLMWLAKTSMSQLKRSGSTE